MIIRFTVSNFLSFKEETEFNMLTGDIKRHPHHVYKHPNVDVLRAAAIYGANGAGKSNLIKAIQFLKGLITGEDILRTYQNFKLDHTFSDKPSQLEIEFIINEVAYVYGISFFHDRIAEEWLYQLGFQNNDTLIFERKTSAEHQHDLKLAEKYLTTEKERYFVEFYKEEMIEANKAFISQINRIEEVENIVNFFKAMFQVVNTNTDLSFSFDRMILFNSFKHWVNALINDFDFGIEKFTIYEENYVTDSNENIESILEQLKHKPYISKLDKQNIVKILQLSEDRKSIQALTLKSIHNGVSFDITNESDGTIRLAEYLILIYSAIYFDFTIIIDEIERSIHPTLIKTLLRKIMEIPDLKGQIIFTTHESNLLDLEIFRQDEIWFAEKNEEGATQFYPLSDFKTRADLDIRKGYLNGRFGAIPFLGNLEQFNWNQHEKAESSL